MDVNLKELKSVDRNRVRAFFNFDTMLLPVLVKVIFAVGLILLVLACLIQPFVHAFGVTTVFEHGDLREGVSFHFGRFLWGIVISVVMLVLGTLWLRIFCESMIILFKIHEALVGRKPGEAMTPGPELAAAKPPEPPKADAPPPPATA